jgi:hypothetical protein
VMRNGSARPASPRALAKDDRTRLQTRPVNESGKTRRRLAFAAFVRVARSDMRMATQTGPRSQIADFPFETVRAPSQDRAPSTSGTFWPGLISKSAPSTKCSRCPFTTPRWKKDSAPRCVKRARS